MADVACPTAATVHFVQLLLLVIIPYRCCPRFRACRKAGTSEEVCKFGFSCRRVNCWFQHPQGRQIDTAPGLAVCRHGVDCPNPNCFFHHPEGRHIDPVSFEIYLDELPMPRRPQVPPSVTDVQVYVDFFGQDPDSPELREALVTFYGSVKEVRPIPGQTRGYVSFEEHEAAKKCVDEEAGAWSESERCVTESAYASWRSWTKGAYGIDIAKTIKGQRGCNLDQVMQKIGSNSKLHFGTEGGYAAFTGKVTQGQLPDLRAHLADLLAAAHDEVNAKVRQLDIDAGLPKAFTQEEATEFFKAFGVVESLVLTDSDPDNFEVTPTARVVYGASDDAFSAANDLKGANFFGSAISCSLSPVGQSSDDQGNAQVSNENHTYSTRNRQGWSRLRHPAVGDGTGNDERGGALEGEQTSSVSAEQAVAEEPAPDSWVCVCGYENNEGAFVCGEFVENEGCGQPREK